MVAEKKILLTHNRVIVLGDLVVKAKAKLPKKKEDEDNVATAIKAAITTLRGRQAVPEGVFGPALDELKNLHPEEANKIKTGSQLAGLLDMDRLAMWRGVVDTRAVAMFADATLEPSTTPKPAKQIEVVKVPLSYVLHKDLMRPNATGIDGILDLLEGLQEAHDETFDELLHIVRHRALLVRANQCMLFWFHSSSAINMAFR